MEVISNKHLLYTSHYRKFHSTAKSGVQEHKVSNQLKWPYGSYNDNYNLYFKDFLQENTSYELNHRLSSINGNTVKALQGIPRSQAR
jgi:hypothetical protein